MDILKNIKESLVDILDIDEAEIAPETYIIRDLGAESIDLLELGVMLGSIFKIEIDDDAIFLGSLRLYLEEAGECKNDTAAYLEEKLPFLPSVRIHEILCDLNNGPVLKVKDLIYYIKWNLDNK